MLTRIFIVFALLIPCAHADLLSVKWHQRQEVMSRSQQNKEANDPVVPAYFLGLLTDEMQTDMRVLESYKSARVAPEAWSGYYWPNFVGGLGFRYNDRHFPKGRWNKSLRYVRRHPSNRTSLELLSPSEKYDLAMGISPEEAGSLTTRQWRLGQAEYDQTGKVAIWQGICNGWAGASINFPNPTHSVTVPSARGNITFQPDDIKALGSLLYAHGKFESVFAGRRCNEEHPRMRRGRAIQPECFDVNPADWHLIVTQQLGMNQKPLIIDYINSIEVWNKPVIGYDLSYFDPLNSRTESENFMAVVRPLSQMRNRAYRGRETVYVVGVSMNTTLLFGADSEDTTHVEIKSREYDYTLELDASYRIVGGEWITQQHPDFAWRPLSSTLPMTDGDIYVQDLGPALDLPNPSWRRAALAANSHGSPVTAFVKFLFDQASLP